MTLQGPRANIGDVAAAAGVSRGTVSLALNGKGRISAATRARIEQIAADLNYRPSLRGRRLRGGRSESVALVTALPDAVVGRESHLNFLMALAMPLSQLLLERSYSTLLLPPISDAFQLDNVDVDGAVIIDPSSDDELCAALQDRNIRVVTIGAAEKVRADGVVDRGYAGADVSIGHLTQQGARHVLILQTAQNYTVATAVQRFIDSTDVPEHVRLSTAAAPVSEGTEGGRRAALEGLRRDPSIDAIYAPIDAFAVGAMDAAQDLDLRVPEDLMICTNFDGPRATASTPPMTALDLDLPQMAKTAGELLLDRLDSPGSAARTVPAPTPQLIPRASTARRA